MLLDKYTKLVNFQALGDIWSYWVSGIYRSVFTVYEDYGYNPPVVGSPYKYQNRVLNKSLLYLNNIKFKGKIELILNYNKFYSEWPYTLTITDVVDRISIEDTPVVGVLLEQGRFSSLLLAEISGSKIITTETLPEEVGSASVYSTNFAESKIFSLNLSSFRQAVFDGGHVFDIPVGYRTLFVSNFNVEIPPNSENLVICTVKYSKFPLNLGYDLIYSNEITYIDPTGLDFFEYLSCSSNPNCGFLTSQEARQYTQIERTTFDSYVTRVDGSNIYFSGLYTKYTSKISGDVTEQADNVPFYKLTPYPVLDPGASAFGDNVHGVVMEVSFNERAYTGEFNESGFWGLVDFDGLPLGSEVAVFSDVAYNGSIYQIKFGKGRVIPLNSVATHFVGGTLIVHKAYDINVEPVGDVFIPDTVLKSCLFETVNASPAPYFDSVFQYKLFDVVALGDFYDITTLTLASADQQEQITEDIMLKFFVRNQQTENVSTVFIPVDGDVLELRGRLIQYASGKTTGEEIITTKNIASDGTNPPAVIVAKLSWVDKSNIPPNMYANVFLPENFVAELVPYSAAIQLNGQTVVVEYLRYDLINPEDFDPNISDQLYAVPLKFNVNVTALNTFTESGNILSIFGDLFNFDVVTLTCSDLKVQEWQDTRLDESCTNNLTQIYEEVIDCYRGFFSSYIRF